MILKLYTTSHCHLCELAFELVLQQCNAKQIELVEISNSESLLFTYGTRIPVLQRTGTLAELNWPFSADDLHRFLSTKNKKASM